MKSRLGLLVGIAALIVLSRHPVSAHHSFAAEFDINKPVTLKGTITKVEWINPHVYLYVETKDAAGKATSWALSTFSPGALRRNGITRANFGQGQTVTATAYHAKDGSNFAFMRRLVFADGHAVELWLGDEAAKELGTGR
jgi:hypothetical protein